MRILKFFVMAAVPLFVAVAAADIIGPHGEPPPHHYLPNWNKDLIKQDFPVYLSVDKVSPGSTLVFVKKGGYAADEARCTGRGPCSITIGGAGDLYLAPEGSLPGGVEDFGPPELLRLIHAGKLDYLMTFKRNGQSYKSRMSCYLQKKGPSYIIKCRH